MSRAEDTVVIKNIYYMIAYAFRAVSLAEVRSLEAELFDNVLDLLAAVLAAGLSFQRRRGFEREYLSRSDEGTRIVGRIDTVGTMRLRARRSQRVRCVFDEREEDTYKNRVLKTTAFYLLKSDDVGEARKRDLKQTLMLMDGIEFLDPRRISWGSLRYHRNNRSYLLLMNVCYLVLHDLLMRDESGELRLANVLGGESLHRLYEKFVLEYFRRHHPELRPSAREIDRGAEGATDFLPRMITDVTLMGSRGMLIVDAKCYGTILGTHYDKEILSPANVNQIFSYVMHAASDGANRVSGMLLYARTQDEGAIDARWSDLGHEYFCRTLDLGVDFDEIAAQLEAIAALVV